MTEPAPESQPDLNAVVRYTVWAVYARDASTQAMAAYGHPSGALDAWRTTFHEVANRSKTRLSVVMKKSSSSWSFSMWTPSGAADDAMSVRYDTTEYFLSVLL